VITILLTGFGPFPGAPHNPTGPLVERLARKRHPALTNVRRVAHVFPTSYQAVDHELPALMAREAPAVLLMFGLAQRRRHLSIESCARNTLSRVHPDQAGHIPAQGMIAPGASAILSLPGPALRLLNAARAAGVPTELSRNAGRYLCNYLCWRATEAANVRPGPRLVAFVHVPDVHRAGSPRRPTRRSRLTLDDLVRAGEAIMIAALQAARTRR
jgi:pyroglutamyl-peptidase